MHMVPKRAVRPPGGGGDAVDNPRDLKKVVFTSTHNLLKNYNVDFGGDGTSLYSPSGWDRGDPPAAPVANPISQSKGTVVSLEVTHYLEPADEPYTLGYYPDQLAFLARNLLGTGPTYTTTSISSANPLPAKVYKFDYHSDWIFTDWSSHTDSGMGSNSFLVTWGTPTGSSVTFKRLNWAVTAATNATTAELVADGIWNALGNVDPPLEPGENGKSLLPDGGNEWKLLDGTFTGECDEQARLMKRGVEILGSSASVALVYASSDSNAMDMESRVSAYDPDLHDYLIYYYPGPNAFEGCCVSASKWYAVWPKVKAGSALDILRNLCSGGAVQKWVRMDDGWTPGQVGESYPSDPSDHWVSHIQAQLETVPCP